MSGDEITLVSCSMLNSGVVAGTDGLAFDVMGSSSLAALSLLASASATTGSLSTLRDTKLVREEEGGAKAEAPEARARVMTKAENFMVVERAMK